MESESSSPGSGPALGRWWGQTPQPSPSTDVMNQLCRVCGEPAAGFHFGAFTCEGCKSFFGRTYNNLGSITECKNNGECVINKKNRTTCKACRLRKCLLVGMSKSGSRYGRRSNWFKIHCLLQEQQQAGAGAHLKEKSAFALWGESYKTLATSPHFDLDSKGSSTEESITLNNNNLSKDREKSPNTILPSYSAEAAAALWAARHSLFPMQLPHHPVPPLQMPFMPPFAGFSPPGHPQAQRNVLLPFIQNLQSSPSPQSNHQPLTVSSSPSRSSQGSVSSQSPPPSKNHLRNSPPILDHSSESTERHSPLESRLDKIRVLANHQEKTVHEADARSKPNQKITEEHSVALLRGLGPVQDQPMDLSIKFVEVKNRRKSKLCQRVKHRGCDESESSEGEVSENDSEGISDSVENNNEHFNKPKTPLDLTKSARLEV